MPSIVYTLVLFFVAGAHSKEAPSIGVNDCPKSGYENKLLERLIKSEVAQREMELTLIQLQKNVRNLETNLQDKSCRDQEPQDKKLKDINSKVDGFSVTAKSYIENLRAFQIIVFDNVVYNPGNSYDATTGIFKVPVNGTYFISGSIMCTSGKRIQTEIMAGSRALVRLYANALSAHDQGANSIAVDLQAGVEVYMRVDQYGSDALMGDHWSSFSAVCLKTATTVT